MGFSYPQGLYSLGFLAVLVWIYLRERRQRALEVPSLLLWRSVREESRRSRFSVDPLFLLQAILLASLALGLAQPYLERRAAGVELRRAILVFDTSASMQTIEGGERRFDHARRKAREVVAALHPAEDVMVIAVEARPRVVVAFTRDRMAVGRAIDALEPGDGPGRLPLGIQLARSAGGGGGEIDIVVFTDLPRADLSAPLAAGERLRYFRFGRTDDNVAVAALRVYQNPFQEAGEAQAYALVKNYSGAPKEARLRVRLGTHDLLEEPLHLGPREGRAVPIRRLVEPGPLEARLDVADALGVDNRAVAFVRETRAIRILAVSASAELFQDLRSVAEAVPAFRLSEASPSEVFEEELRAADVALFHGAVPDGPILTNTLFVYPPRENPLFPVKGDVVHAQILDWDEHDPILRDLRYLEALPLERARRIRAPDWARTLIASRAGTEEFPLALAGETDGRRVVVFAFDLAEASVRRSENLSLLLLVLNALKWLTPPDPEQPIQIDIGERYRETLPRPQPVTVTSPNGSRQEWPERTEVAVDLDRAGEYQIRIGEQRRTVYANLFDPEESDVGREGPVGVELVETGAPSVRYVTARWVREYGGWLYAAALLLAFVEWVWAMRRRGATDA